MRLLIQVAGSKYNFYNLKSLLNYGSLNTVEILIYDMVVSPQSPASEAQSVQSKRNNMASKQSSVADTRAELAELVKRKAEVAVRNRL